MVRRRYPKREIDFDAVLMFLFYVCMGACCLVLGYMGYLALTSK